MHHHRLLNCQSPESPMCNDIFESLNASVQQLMTAHYEAEHFQEAIDKLHEGCTSILEFLRREVHALTLYNPHVTLNTQVPHGISLTGSLDRKAGAVTRGKRRISQHQPLAPGIPMLPSSMEMTHRIVSDVQVTSDPVWLRLHGAVRTKNGWMVPPFTDLRPFVEMIKGTSVVTIDSLFNIADNVEHDTRRIASAHTQCGTDALTRSAVTPDMPHRQL